MTIGKAQSRLIGILALLGGWLVFQSAMAADRLIDGPPYDLIVLADESKTEVKVQPLDLPERKLPDSPAPDSKLMVRMLESPDQKYEVEWKNIARVLLFEKLVLDEAEKFVSASKFDAAYENYAFLERHHPKTPDLENSYRKFLFEDAKNLARLGKFEAALAPLVELHRRDPLYDKLEAAVANVIGRLADQRIAEGNSEAAQALVKRLGEMYPQNKQLEARRQKIAQEAERLVAEAETHAQAEHWREAVAAVERAVSLFPEVVGGKELQATARRKHPRVVVGVTSSWMGTLNSRPDDWASLRTSRLLTRPLLEAAPSTTEGVQYVCPLGKLTQSRPATEPNARGRLAYQFELHPNIGVANENRMLSAADLADVVLGQSRLGGPLAAHVARVHVGGSQSLTIELWAGPPRPEAWLAVAWNTGMGGAVDPRKLIGPYAAEKPGETELAFLARAAYFAAEASQPKEIVERRYADSVAAVKALRRGEINVIDRVFPAQLAALRGDETIAVGAYAAPTVVCLLPNLRNPRLARADFRRGLLLALNREGMLKQMVMAGNAAPENAVVSGPFPRPATGGNPLLSVYDTSVPPRPFDPHLAAALLRRGEAENDPARAVAPLVLAHPPHDLARAVCRVIQQQWAVVGVPIELQECPPNDARTVPGAGGRKPFDLLYAELQIRDPLIDAETVLGARGLAGSASGYMTAALDKLRAAGSLEAAGEQLRVIHRLCHDETSLLPLWQLTEHFAHRKTLSGLGDKPLSLYQSVERWKLE